MTTEPRVSHAVLTAFALAALAVAAGFALAACPAAPPQVVTPTPAPLTTPVPPGRPPLDGLRSADPARDLGVGEPGAFCATSRLGKFFDRDGVRYTCSGPKPYRWRAEDSGGGR